MSNPIENLKQISELKPYDLNCNIFSVYDYDSLSLQELLCKFFEKINECIDIANATFKLAEWLVSVGLKQEVALTLNKWLEDGTLKEIINEEIFNDLNTKINETIIKVESNKNSIVSLTERFNKASKLIEYNVLDYDIDNTGVEDITEKLNNLISLVSVKGGIIYFPKGSYKVLSQIVMKPYVVLKGQMAWRGKDKEGYSVFKCHSLNKPQFLMREYTTLENFYFDYPEQGTTLNTIKKYDWLIATDTTHLCDDIQLKELYMPNCYNGIKIDNGGRFNLLNIYGQPINQGLYIDNCADISSITRVEFWTFSYYVDSEIYDYILENGKAFEFKRVDGVICNNMFCYGYNIGFHLNGSVWGTFTGCSVDITNNPILVWDCNIVEFIGGAFIGASYKSTICNIRNVKDSFKLLGCNFFGSNSIGVLNDSPTGNVTIDINFKDFDNSIKIPVIHNGKNMFVRSNKPNEKMYGSINLNGVDVVTGGGSVVKNISFNDLGFGGDDVSFIPNGFKVNMGKSVVGDKSISGSFDLSTIPEFTKGVYYIEFTIKQLGTTDRKRIGIDLRNEEPKIINNIINKYPYNVEETIFRYPIYVSNPQESKRINFFFNYYDEPKPLPDYIEIKNINIVKMGNKVLNSTIENAYKLYDGNGIIDYSINR